MTSPLRDPLKSNNLYSGKHFYRTNILVSAANILRFHETRGRVNMTWEFFTKNEFQKTAELV